MLPRLIAEEALAGIDITAIGAGSYTAETSSEILQRLRAKAGTDQLPRAIKPGPADLSAIGIGVSFPAPEAPLIDG